MFILLFFVSLVFAQDIIVFASPLEVRQNGAVISNGFGNEIVFNLASRHGRHAMAKRDFAWEYIANGDYFLVYNEQTIKYRFDGCNYKQSPVACAVKNKHYYVRAYVDLREDEGVVTFELWGPRGTMINSTSESSYKIIQWIRQQEITVYKDGFHLPKEELPLKWEIPYRLFRKHFENASMKLWTGVRLK